MNTDHAVGNRSTVCLADFTSPGLIIPHLQGNDMASALQELSFPMQREGCVTDALQFYQGVLNREFLTGTVWDQGLAFPHGLVLGLEHPKFALGRSERPIIWRTNGLRQIKLIFLLAVPATDWSQYILLESAFAKLGGESPFLTELRAAKDQSEIMSVLQQIKLRR